MANIVVIGGGVVGISCALELLRDGHQVTVLEPNAPGEGASWASCGFIAISGVVPLSKPGTLMKAPQWLLDPSGPLALRGSSLLTMLPWFLRFVAQSSMTRLRDITHELSRLSRNALTDTEELLQRHGLSHMLRPVPVIELYDSAGELAQARKYHYLRRDLGFEIEEITGAEAQEMEPSLAGDFAAAAVFRDWRPILDPKLYVTALHEAFMERGGVVRPVQACGFDFENGRVNGVRVTGGETIPAERIVLSAGAWSKELAGQMEVKVLLEGVIGYQTCLEAPGVSVNNALVYANGGFGITPFESGLAVAGSAEFAALNAQPRWKRADILVEKAKRVLPGLQPGPASRRIGRRPMTPDTLPLIGCAAKDDRVIFATGHGQLGVTLAASTARIVADIATGRRPHIDIAAFRPDRF